MSLLHADVGHQNVVVSLAFSPDGRRILSGSWDGTAKLWDVQNGTLLRTVSWGAKSVNGVVWSSSGEHVAVAAGLPRTPRDEKQLASYQAYFDRRDTSYFDSQSDDDAGPVSEVRVFDASTGTLVNAFIGCGNGVAFAPDGRTLAAISWGSLCIIDLAGGLRISQIDDVEQSELRNVIYSEDGKHVACVDSDGVFVFDAQSAEPRYVATDKCLFEHSEEIEDAFVVTRLPSPLDSVEPVDEAAYMLEFWQRTLPGFCPGTSSDGGMCHQRIAFSADGQLAAVHRERGFNREPPASTLGGVTILDTSGGETIRFFAYPDSKWLRTTTFSPDGKLLAAAGDHQTIILWNVETGREVRRIGHPPPAILSVACAHSKPLVAAGAADGTVLLCDRERPTVLAIDRECESPVSHVEFTPDAESLVVASRTGDLRVLSVPGLEPKLEFCCHEARFLGGAVLSDGKRFVSVGYADEPEDRNDKGKPAEIITWSLEDGRKLQLLELPDVSPIRSVAASHDRERLAISFGKLVLVADVAGGLRRGPALKKKETWILSVAFSADDKHLLVANEGYGMQMVGIGGTESLRSFAATRDGPTSLAFGHNGTFVVRSTAYFEEIELFEASTGILKKCFLGHQAPVMSLAVSPDDTCLASGGRDGTLKLWDVKTATLKASIVTFPVAADSHPTWECLVNS